MSTYKEIRGLKVRDYTTNPDNPIEGQLWYNTTDNVAKYQIPQVLSSWSTAVSLNSARQNVSNSGVRDSAITAGGYGPASSNIALSESYNGTSWTETSDLNTARRI